MVEHSALGHFSEEQEDVSRPTTEVARIPNTLDEGPSEEFDA